MLGNRENFIKAIHQKKLITAICYLEPDDCPKVFVPLDFGPAKDDTSGKDKYHVIAVYRPKKFRRDAIGFSNLNAVQILDVDFDPKKYVTWKPKWNIERDW